MLECITYSKGKLRLYLCVGVGVCVFRVIMQYVFLTGFQVKEFEKYCFTCVSSFNSQNKTAQTNKNLEGATILVPVL